MSTGGHVSSTTRSTPEWLSHPPPTRPIAHSKLLPTRTQNLQHCNAASIGYLEHVKNTTRWHENSWDTLSIPTDVNKLGSKIHTGNLRGTAGTVSLGWINHTSSSFPLIASCATRYFNHPSEPLQSHLHPRTVKTGNSGSNLDVASLAKQQPTAFTSSVRPTRVTSPTSAASRANNKSITPAALFAVVSVLYWNTR